MTGLVSCSVNCYCLESSLVETFQHRAISPGMFICRQCSVVSRRSCQYLAHLRQNHATSRSESTRKCSRDIMRRMRYTQHRLQNRRKHERREADKVVPGRTVFDVTSVLGETQVGGNCLDLSGLLSHTREDSALVPSNTVLGPVHHDHNYTELTDLSRATNRTGFEQAEERVEKSGDPREVCETVVTELRCSVCHASFTEHQSLTEHLTCHVTQSSTSHTPFHCYDCDVYFTTQQNLAKHKKNHTSDTAFTSDTTFTSDPTFTSDTTFTCCICTKYFDKREKLIDHMWMHGEGRDYPCASCRRSFPQRGLLKAHVATHHMDKPFPCTICTKSFAQRGHLKTHMITHTDSRPFTCGVCERSFSLRHHLTRHQKVHSGALLFSCNVCSTRFTNQTNLTLHMKDHAEVDTLSCSLCDKRFALRRSLMKHVRTHITHSLPLSLH